MNRSLLILLTILFVAVSCRKPASDQTADPTTVLIGKWRYTEHYLRIAGGAGQWYPVQPSGETVAFKADGTFQSAAAFSPTFTHYEIIDSTTIKFTPAPSASGFVLMKYAYQNDSDTLLLYPVAPACVEGCAYKFLRTAH